MTWALQAIFGMEENEIHNNITGLPAAWCLLILLDLPHNQFSGCVRTRVTRRLPHLKRAFYVTKLKVFQLATSLPLTKNEIKLKIYKKLRTKQGLWMIRT